MDLVTIKNNNIFTDSLVIANGTGNKHQNVKELIRKYDKQLREFGAPRLKRVGINGTDNYNVYYELNEPQATFLMTLLRNSDIVVDFKLKLTKEFYRMRMALMQRNSTEWLQTRKQGKLIRRSETDVIAELIEYAKEQGSKNSDMLYLTYTKLVNNAVDIKKGQREHATQKVLDTIAFLEDMILNTIKEEMRSGTYYKEIYKKCKGKAKILVNMAYLPNHKLLAS